MQKGRYVIHFVSFSFDMHFYRQQRATNTTIKLFQFHASYFRIDSFLHNGNKVPRSWDCSQYTSALIRKVARTCKKKCERAAVRLQQFQTINRTGMLLRAVYRQMLNQARSVSAIKFVRKRKNTYDFLNELLRHACRKFRAIVVSL